MFDNCEKRRDLAGNLNMSNSALKLWRIFLCSIVLWGLSGGPFSGGHCAVAEAPQKGLVMILDMDMGILPGTGDYLRSAISEGRRIGAGLIVVELDTPGGLLQTAQDMVKAIFDSDIPIVFYVSPSGASATSAGVFITMAAHVAAMAPGTSIGAAHPVMGNGSNIQSDLRTKAENITVAMVKAISEERNRNAAWAEKAVKESASLTEREALKKRVIDFVARDIDELLRKIKGFKVKVGGKEVILGDFSGASRLRYRISFKQKVVNTISDPNVVQLLWLGATTGISIELYHPGAILPGVVGVICLILALAAYQIIPINLGGVLLLVVGSLLLGAELFVPSGVLGLGGIVAIVLGSIYLVDIAEMPGMTVNMVYVVTLALVFASVLAFIVYSVVKAHKRKVATGIEGLIGQKGRAVSNIAEKGKIFVNGEYWNATVKSGVISKGSSVEVKEVLDGMVLVVEEAKD
ncbi:MAG: nodulation protein NfeD [Candidatus Dadabacteria bacterium]|nr:MAG: nodulation protein NfeD [Candidatus Dadabacteria bacterium]